VRTPAPSGRCIGPILRGRPAGAYTEQPHRAEVPAKNSHRRGTNDRTTWTDDFSHAFGQPSRFVTSSPPVVSDPHRGAARRRRPGPRSTVPRARSSDTARSRRRRRGTSKSSRG